MTDQHVQHGVLVGCAPSAQVSPDMTVAIAAGSVLNGNVSASVAAQNATITTADATQDRWDLISVDNAGTVTVTAGTPADVPVQPDDTDVPLAHVYVYSQANASYTGTIVTGVVQDARGFVLVHTSPYHVSGLWYGITSLARSTGGFTVSGGCYLTPYFVGKSLPIQSLGIYVAGAASAGSKARLGLYADDGAGGLSLLGDAGQVAISTTGEKSAALSLTLAPGFVWRACAFQSLTGTANLYIDNPGGFSPVGASSITNAVATSFGAMYFTGVTGALPATLTSPDYSQNSPPAVAVQAA